jgi:uncharacterized protein (DUF2235 family)
VEERDGVGEDYRKATINLARHIGVKDDGDVPQLITFGLAKSKTIILCFDGTGDSFDDENTNVVKLFSCLKKDNAEEQAVYYQSGIGTYTPGYKPWTIIGDFVAKKMDQAVAWYLPEHVMSGYKFLMRTYVEGDRICLFGFSRGAYTARALAAMLHCVGLLPRDNEEHAEIAYSMFSRVKQDYTIPLPSEPKSKSKTTTSSPSDAETEPLLGGTGGVGEGLKADLRRWHLAGSSPNELCARFKKTFSHDVLIDFVGVWDTVASVGGIIPRTLPFVTSNPSIVVFRHAIALDEFRTKFQCLRWIEPPSEKGKYPVDVDEVYFAGNHCDVGGGNTKDYEYDIDENDDPNMNKIKDYHPCRSNLALRWMLGELQRSVLEIDFEFEQLKRWGIPFRKDDWGRALFNFADKRVRLMDVLDARMDVNGPKWWWNFVEVLPWMKQHQDPVTGEVRTAFKPNFRHPRPPMKCTIHNKYCTHDSVHTRERYQNPTPSLYGRRSKTIKYTPKTDIYNKFPKASKNGVSRSERNKEILNVVSGFYEDPFSRMEHAALEDQKEIDLKCDAEDEMAEEMEVDDKPDQNEDLGPDLGAETN